MTTTRKQYWFLFVLTLVVTLNYVDRYVLSILVEPIRLELDLSDTQIGLLTGAAFALFYSTLAIPIARLAERYNRLLILFGAVLIWSVATAACGLAGGFLMLLLARIFVGVGEAGAMAPSMSMLADVFPIEKRGTIMGLFALGAPLGGALAPLLGGWLEPAIGWRATFFVLGGAGLPLALLLVATVREPRRGLADGLEKSPIAVPFREAARRLFRRRTFALLTPALILMALGEYSMILWMPAFFQRTFDIAPTDLGAQIALYQGLPFFLGTLAGGIFVDRLAKRDQRWMVWLPALGAILTVPVVLMLFASNTASMAFALLILPSAVNGLYIAPSYALVQNLSAVHSRATAAAILTFTVTIVGAGLGPFLLGALSDFLSSQYGNQSLRYAFFSLVPMYALAAFLFTFIGSSLVRDIEDARSDSLSGIDDQAPVTAAA
ncbi:spinster family MFS transporter [Sphingosinicella sp.]|uniref:spinster family MFS transporter n=1 Tax=Sphingosinicella sp. TaxID=1917971 RepID=UPI0035B4EDC9